MTGTVIQWDMLASLLRLKRYYFYFSFESDELISSNMKELHEILDYEEGDHNTRYFHFSAYS